MNLKSEISSELWEAISSSYKAEIYKSAVLDAIHFLSDAIREKADLDSDGVALINKAFGGNNPLLKINQFQTQTEKDEHEGFLFSLRGLYTGIRNPRSHQKYEDSEQTANAIILFINFLLKQLNLATPVFTIEKWIQSVLDPNFVASEKYINLLINEIPDKKMYDTILEIYRCRNKIASEILKIIIKQFFIRFDQQKKQDFLAIISEEIRYELNDELLGKIIQSLPAELWVDIHEIPKTKVEIRIINEISQGKIEINVNTYELEAYIDEYQEGLFAINGIHLLEYFSDQEALRKCLENKICKLNLDEFRYLITYFADFLPKFLNITNLQSLGIIEEITRMYIEFDENSPYAIIIEDLPIEWRLAFEKAIEKVQNEF